MARVVRLLVPLAGEGRDAALLEEVAALAGPRDAEVVLVSVAHYHTRDGRPVAVERAEQILEKAREHLLQAGLTTRTLVGRGEVADEIVRLAAAEGADLIVMGARGHLPLWRLVEGSIPDRVRRRSRVPVLLVRGVGREQDPKRAA